MKRSRLVQTLFALSASLLLGLVAARTAYVGEGQDKVQDLRGSFGGFTQDVGNPNIEPGAAQLDVIGQERRRFDAIFVGDPNILPEEFQVAGTVSASNNVNAGGGSNTASIVIHYRLADFGLGAATLEGRSKLVGDPNLVGNPDLAQADILLRDYLFDPRNPSPDASGLCEGEATSMDGSTRMWSLDAFRREGSLTGFEGDLRIVDPNTGAIGQPCVRYSVDGDGHVVMIGAAPGVVVKILANFFNPQPDPPGLPALPARMEGVYQIIAVGDPNLSGPGGPDTFEDVGTFVLQQVVATPVSPPDEIPR